MDDIYFVPRGQMPADGFCGMCPQPVPATMPNKFYCSWGCASVAFSHYRQMEWEVDHE